MLRVGPTDAAPAGGATCLIPSLEFILEQNTSDSVPHSSDTETDSGVATPELPSSGDDTVSAPTDPFVAAWQAASAQADNGEYGAATMRMEQLLRLNQARISSSGGGSDDNAGSTSADSSVNKVPTGEDTLGAAGEVESLPELPHDPLVLETCRVQLAAVYAAYGAAILDADTAMDGVLTSILMSDAELAAGTGASKAGRAERDQQQDVLLQRQHELALVALTRALAIHSECAAAHYSLGVLWGRRRDFVRSVESHSAALSIEPRLAASYCGIATAHLELGDATAAVEYFRHALRWDPNLEPACAGAAMALTAVGASYVMAGDHRTALKHYKLALRHNARYALAHYNMGVSYTALRKIDSAVASYELAVHFDPFSTTAWNNLGMLHREQHNLLRAVECCETALRYDARSVETLNNLGVIHTALGNTEKALSYLLQACYPGQDSERPPLSPVGSPFPQSSAASNTRSPIDASVSLPVKATARAPAFNNLGVLYRDLGMMKESIEAYNDCLQLEPQHRNASQNLLLSLNYLPMDRNGIRMMQQAHIHWGDTVQQLLEKGGWRTHVHRPPGSLRGLENEQRCLRIGYISADFCTHSVSYFVESVLRAHDPTQRRIVASCYSLVVVPDDRTTYLSQLPGVRAFRNVVNLTAVECASLIRSDEIDILIELAGHTGGNALDVMAFHPAPIQITWIGYPNTTGLSSIQYRLTDSVCDPLDTVQQYSETLIRVDHLEHTGSNELGSSCSRMSEADASVTRSSSAAASTSTGGRDSEDSTDDAQVTAKYGFLCYSPEPLPGQGGIGSTTPPVRLPPSMRVAAASRCSCPTSSACPGRVITFGSFNNLAKTTDAVVAAWCRVLKAVPHSVMVLKCKPLGTKTGRERVFAMFEANGVSADRLHLIPLAAGRYDHLETYASVDVALDTFPYSGTTTTCEAAWMGVPTVMLTGQTHANNVSAGLFACIDRSPVDVDRDLGVLRSASHGLSEQISSGAASSRDEATARKLVDVMPRSFSELLVASSVDDFVRLAVNLATNPALICAIRVLLRPRMSASPLCDANGFTRHLEENVLRRCWIAYCRGSTFCSVEAPLLRGDVRANGPRGSDTEDRVWSDRASTHMCDAQRDGSNDDVMPPADDERLRA